MPFPLDLWLIHPEAEMCSAFRKRFASLPNVSVLQTRFEDLPPHDCFVTAANSFGIMTAGIDAAVVHKHGKELMARVQHRILDQYLGEQPIGTSFLIETSNAQSPYIAHSPTMRVPGPITGRDYVYSATWASFLAIYQHNLTAEQKINSVVFPAMGAGFGSVPFEEVARQMATAYRHYLDPPHRFDWEMVTKRYQRIAYDQGHQVVR